MIKTQELVNIYDVLEYQSKSENIYDVTDMIILDQENICDVLDENNMDQNKDHKIIFITFYLKRKQKVHPRNSSPRGCPYE